MKYLFFSLVFLYNFMSCTSTNKPASKETTKNDTVLSGNYLVTTLYGEDVTAHNLTMIFTPHTTSVQGFAGCNQYSANYTMEARTFRIGFPTATKIYCENDSTERLFFKALLEIHGVDKNKLTLLDRTEDTIVILKRL